MKAGLLRHKITLQKPTLTGNAYGTNQDITFTDFKTLPAYVTYIGGNKNINNYEMFASQSVQFQIRYRKDFDETHRIVFNQKFYSILNIKEVGFKDSIVITAELQQQ
jgi:head-tail adaptor